MSINWEDPDNYVLASFLCVLGAAVGFGMAYAVGWLFRDKDVEQSDRFVIPNDQALYMREVRNRNLQAMAMAAGARYLVEEDSRATASPSRWLAS